jgi:cytochrome P450
LIAEQMMHGYPTPPAAWVDHWHGLLDKYRLQPTLLDTMVDMDCDVHQCMGSNLARLEISALLGAMIKRIDTIAVLDSERHVNNVLRGFRNLDVRIN